MPVRQTSTVPRTVPISTVSPVESTEKEDTGYCAVMIASGGGKYETADSGEEDGGEGGGHRAPSSPHRHHDGSA